LSQIRFFEIIPVLNGQFIINSLALFQMKSLKIWMAIILLLSSGLSKAEIRNVATENVRISGSCAHCKEGIEAAALGKNISKASWDKDTKIALITYDSKKTSVDAILKKVALAGYDNESYLAPDDAYAKLEDCCKYARAGKREIMAGKEMPGHQHGAVPDTEKTGVATPGPLKAVLDAYYAIKDALVNSDGNAASTNATNLVKAIKAVKMDQLGSEQHTVWMKVMKDLDFDADHIAETKDVGHQRDHFSTLSENMYKLIKSGKPSEAVYYQHCPMAKEGKGANWLSQVPTIKNPYYGAQMLNCGKTTETIK
jgi:copper chaperone CopZ